MSNTHTIEPRIINQDKINFGGSPLDVIATCAWEMVDDNADANARRIVACVNACANLRTELIEKGGGLFDILQNVAQQRDELQQQRDTLLAALKMIANEAYLQPEWERYAKDRIASIESPTQDQ